MPPKLWVIVRLEVCLLVFEETEGDFMAFLSSNDFSQGFNQSIFNSSLKISFGCFSPCQQKTF